MQHAELHSDMAREAMANAGLSCVALADECGRAVDLVLSLSPDRLAVIRCVERLEPHDHAALATMSAGGDFAWAAALYQRRDANCSSGLVESFHATQVHQLIARLIALREILQ